MKKHKHYLGTLGFGGIIEMGAKAKKAGYHMAIDTPLAWLFKREDCESYITVSKISGKCYAID